MKIEDLNRNEAPDPVTEDVTSAAEPVTEERKEAVLPEETHPMAEAAEADSPEAETVSPEADFSLSEAKSGPAKEENSLPQEAQIDFEEEYKGQINDLSELDLVLEEDKAEEEEYELRRAARRKSVAANREKPTLYEEIMSWVVPIALALVFSILLKSFVIISARVPSASMENTIMTGDNLFGNRLAYKNKDPERGDIVIFYFPDDESKKYIKRIIGLPGETVVIDNGLIYIDGSTEALYEPYLKEAWVNGTGYYEFHVPEDSYLMLGDNRNISADARYWTNTYVSRDKIIAKASFVYFPLNHIGLLND